jgi:signal peptidase I
MVWMDNQNSTISDSVDPSHLLPAPKKFSFFRELLTFVFIAVVIVLPFRMFIAEPYVVSGTSMFPTFDTGHYLIVDKITWKFETPKRYDVVVMIFPKDTTKDFIKRIIGFPGETVVIKNGAVSIINDTHPQGFALDQSFVKFPKDDTLTAHLKADEYFVMGDNRAGSYDSRYWGPLPKSDIIGYPLMRLLPITDIGLLPGGIHTADPAPTQ